jgi:hypothetical protein
LSEITQKIKTYCLDLIMAQANGTYNAVPDYFTDLADQAEHPHDRKLYQEAMHGLGFDRKLIMTAFEKAIEPFFDDLIGAPGTAQRKKIGGRDTSSFSGSNDLEEKLALETMCEKARSRIALPMSSITRSFNGLMGDDWVEQHQNPLEPELLILAWFDAIHTLDLPLKVYLALYGLFDIEMLRVLPKMYEKIGRYLDYLPIHKDKKKTTAKTESLSDDSSEFSSEGYEDDFDDIDAPTSTSDYSGDETIDGIEDSQSSADTTSLDTSADDAIDYDQEPQAELHTNELIRLLDSLQRNRDIDDSEFYSVSYLLDYRALLESFNAISGQKINPWTVGQINDDVFDMTGLLFSFIMEDAHLPDDIRYHISRLQIPYLKLALQDKSIFSNKTHPARQLLNDLAESISLWDPTHTGGLDLLLRETIAVIDGILNNYMMEPQIFSHYQNSFSDFLSGDAHIDDEMQQRQKDTASKTVKADNARLYIESTLDSICDNKRIPPIVNQILEAYWSKVLFLEYLKGGSDSDDYSVFIETTEILVNSVQAKKTADARKDMAKQLPNLIRRLKAGFATISVAAFETIDIFRDLQECHMLVLKERPELKGEDEFEVDEAEFKAFKKDQSTILEWNRTDLENSLLEESIERSLNSSDSDPYAFEDNNNIISSRNDMVYDATLAKVSRERVIIDNELKEARDAYEQALKEHKEKHAIENEPEETDDFMTQFFQDPAFIQKQYAGSRDLSSTGDSHLIQKSDDNAIDEDVFEALEGSSEGSSDSTLDDPLDGRQAEQEGKKWTSGFDKISKAEEERATLLKAAETPEDPEAPIEVIEAIEETDDDLAGRAHGALEEEFNELGDDQVTELIARLKVGLWVDLVHADGSQVRAKIMAIVPTVGKYIFGDRLGKKIADFNSLNLAEALRTGSIRVTEEDNAFDKTLESVIANLRVLKKADDE